MIKKHKINFPPHFGQPLEVVVNVKDFREQFIENMKEKEEEDIIQKYKLPIIEDVEKDKISVILKT